MREGGEDDEKDYHMGNEDNEETEKEEDGWSGDESFSANLEKENGKI